MNTFEKACNEIDDEIFTGEMESENVVEFIRNSKIATVTFCQKKYVNKIRKLQKLYPDDVQIINDENDIIVAHIPTKWLRIAPPRELTEEQKESARQRLALYRRNNKEKEEKED